MQDLQQQRVINADQKAIQRIAALRRDPAADPEAHQIGIATIASSAAPAIDRFGEGQRPNSLPSRPSEGENRDKRQGDDQQADKQRRPTSTEASVMIFQRVSLLSFSPGC